MLQNPTKPHHGAALRRLIEAVAERKVTMEPDDVYKMCMVVNAAEDRLGLKQEASFLQALATERALMSKDALPPFQSNIVDEALKDVTPDIDLSSVPAESVTAAKVEETFKELDVVGDNGEVSREITFSDPTAEERIRAIWDCVALYQQNNYMPGDAARVAEHCVALDPILRKLTGAEVGSLARALATLNYYNFDFSTLLARRCCETASQFTAQQLCQVYFNLVKLNVQDSLVAIVRRIEEQIAQLTWKDAFLFFQALERQNNTTAAPAALVPKVAQHCVPFLQEIPTLAFHRATVVAMCRYNSYRHPALAAIVKEIGAKTDQLQERDLLPILQALVNCKASRLEGFSAIFYRAQNIVGIMNLSAIEQLIDTVSLCPLDSSAFMNRVMDRLSTDVGRLTISQLCFLIDLMSSYPPMKGSPCAVALAFTANLKKDAIDSSHCEIIIIALARMQHFTNDFFDIVAFSFAKRQGLRTFDTFSEFMSCLGPASVRRDERLIDILAQTVDNLAPVLNDEEIMHIRKAITSLGITDRRVQQRILGTTQTRNAGFSQQRKVNMKQKRNYDPADDLI